MSELAVGSLFAGIGGFDLGFERAGFRVAWCVEWDKAAQSVLRKRFPGARILSDVREVDASSLETVDVVCGGFPCQDLSSAGKRAGLAGERSGLFHEAMRIVRGVRPKLVVLENVVGLLTSNQGHDFATVLREMGQGWPCEEVAWRVLDSQHFGVPQRRRRVFVVASASLGCAESVLALAEGGGGDSPKSGKKGKANPRRTPSGVGGVGEPMFADLYNQVITGTISPTVTSATGISNASGPKVVAPARVPAHVIDMQGRKGWVGIYDESVCPTLCKMHGNDVHAVAFKTGNSAKARSDGLSIDVCPTLSSDAGGNTVPAVAFAQNQLGEVRVNKVCGTLNTNANATGRNSPLVAHGDHSGKELPFAVTVSSDEVRLSEVTGTLDAARESRGSSQQRFVVQSVVDDEPTMIIRRLMPVECERLQGFPDGWTQVGTEEKPTSDSQRYRQVGNAVTVNVAEWIARRAAKALMEER